MKKQSATLLTLLTLAATACGSGTGSATNPNADGSNPSGTQSVMRSVTLRATGTENNDCKITTVSGDFTFAYGREGDENDPSNPLVQSTSNGYVILEANNTLDTYYSEYLDLTYPVIDDTLLTTTYADGSEIPMDNGWDLDPVGAHTSAANAFSISSPGLPVQSYDQDFVLTIAPGSVTCANGATNESPYEVTISLAGVEGTETSFSAGSSTEDTGPVTALDIDENASETSNCYPVQFTNLEDGALPLATFNGATSLHLGVLMFQSDPRFSYPPRLSDIDTSKITVTTNDGRSYHPTIDEVLADMLDNDELHEASLIFENVRSGVSSATVSFAAGAFVCDTGGTTSKNTATYTEKMDVTALPACTGTQSGDSVTIECE